MNFSKFYISLLFLFCFQTITAQSDSLWAAFYNTENYTEKARIAYAYQKLNIRRNPDSCLKLIDELAPYFEQINPPTEVFNQLNVKGIILQARGRYDSSIQALDQAFLYLNEKTDSLLLSKYYLNKGINYRYKGDYRKAIKYSQKSLEISELIDYKSIRNNSIAEIGNAYLSLESFNEAERYQRKALRLALQEGDKLLEANTCNSMTVLFDELFIQENEELKANKGSLIDSMLFYNERAITIQKSIGNIFGLANAQRNRIVYLKRAKRDDNEVLEASLEMLQVDKKINNQEGILIGLNNIAGAYENLGQFEKSIEYAQQALELSKKIEHLETKRKAYFILSVSHGKLKQFEQAYEYLDSSNYVGFTIKGIEVNEKVAEIQTKYEVAQKDKLINEQKAIQAQQVLAITERNNWIMMLTATILIVLLLGLYFQQLTSKRKQAQQDALLLEEKQRGLDAVIVAQEEERERIAKDLHDGIGQQLSSIKMAVSNLANSFYDNAAQEGKKLNEISKLLDKSAKETRAISHQMMPASLKIFGLRPSVESMLEEAFMNTGIKYSFDYFKLQERYNEKIELSLYRICQELINNSIKHSQATEVNVQLYQNKKSLVLAVEDNGIGIKLPLEKQGHGFLNIESRLSFINGTYHIEPQEKGTLIQVRVTL